MKESKLSWMVRVQVPPISSNTTWRRKRKMQIKHRAFNILSEKFRPQHNENILPIKYSMLSWEEYESRKEHMGWLRFKANECDYKECDRCLEEQFINRTNDDYSSNHQEVDIYWEKLMVWKVNRYVYWQKSNVVKCARKQIFWHGETYQTNQQKLWTVHKPTEQRPRGGTNTTEQHTTHEDA